VTRRPFGALAFAAVVAVIALAAEASAPGHTLTAQERRGRQIYLTGASPSGKPITASMGGSSLSLPGSILPCANCHGYDGRGKPEGGVVPPEIRWEALTKPYGRSGSDGRLTPPHNEATLAATITAGVDPAGNAISPAMPKYALDSGDLSALVAYLRRLGEDRDPGVASDEITIGTVLTATGPAAEASRAAHDVIAAYFEEVNERGGVYSRRLKLSSGAASRPPLPEDVFAVINAAPGEPGSDLVSWCEVGGIPCIDPFTTSPAENAAVSRYVFYLFSGIKTQARALVDFAAQAGEVSGVRAAIVSSPGAVPPGILDAVEAQCRSKGFAAVDRVAYRPGGSDAAELSRRLKAAATTAIFVLAPPGAESDLMREAARLDWAPNVYLSGSLVGREILAAPPAFKDRIFVAYPFWPPDPDAPGIRDLLAFLARQSQPPTHLVAQLSAYAAAKVLVEGLQRAGRDVSREKLVDVLEGFYGFETGVTPPIVFGPNRHIGVEGASIGVVDLEAKTLRRVNPPYGANHEEKPLER